MAVWNRVETRLPSWGSIITARLFFVFSGCCCRSHIWITSGVLFRACALYSLPWNCSPCCSEGEYILSYYYCKLFLSIWFFFIWVFSLSWEAISSDHLWCELHPFRKLFPYIYNRVSYESWKTWKDVEFCYGIFQDWKVLEKSHWSWKVL